MARRDVDSRPSEAGLPAIAPADRPADPAASDTEKKKPGQLTGAAGRRRLGLGMAATLLLAAMVPAVLWISHESGHVNSRNAMVRSHLSSLGTAVEGVIAEVNVDAGDVVEAGEVLARLDDRHFLADVEEARAQVTELDSELSVARAKIAVERRGAENLVAKARADVRRQAAEHEAAGSRAEDAEAFYAAREALAEDQAISGEIVRDAAARARTLSALARAAGAGYESAQATLQRAELAWEEIAVLEEGLHVLEARLAGARARLDRAEVNVDNAAIRAPASGAVVRRLAQPGMAVEVGTPVISMWLSEDTWVEAWVAEEDLGSIAVGSGVQVRFAAAPGKRFAGVVETIGLATDYEMPMDYLPQPRATRMRHEPLVGVAIRLDEGLPDVLRPGVSAVVDIERSDG